MANDDLPPPQVTPIGQADQPPPEPAESPAPRAELVDPGKQDTGSAQGPGASKADLVQHAYDYARQAEEDQKKARSAFKGMQDEIRSLYKQEQQISQTPAPQEEPYPDEPNTELKSVALAHMFIGIPAAIFGGNKYNAGGALHGLSDLIKEFQNAGSKADIAQRIGLYREQVNIVHQQNEDRFRQYHELMADRRADIHTKLEAITTLAGMYKDQATMDAAATDNWEHFTDYLGKVEKMNADMEEHVYGTMDKLHKAFGDTTEDRLYRSWGAEQYPELREGLFSPDNPRAFGKAVRELEKKKSFYNWRKEHYKEMHPSETFADKDAESKGSPTPSDTPPDEMRKAIQDMKPDVLFGTPKPGEKPKEDRRSKSEKYGYDPRHPFDKPKPVSDE